MARSPKPKGTRLGILIRPQDQRILDQLQRRLATPLETPTTASIIRQAIIALYTQTAVK